MSALVGGGLAALVAAAPARAGGSDGLYGRFDGDLELRADAGVAFASGGPSLAASLSALYLSTAGIYVHYTDAVGADGPRVTRSLATGVRLQPLFLARYAGNLEHGPAHLDLFVDSFAFDLGAFWSAPRHGSWDERPGLELALGAAVPFLPRSTGPFLGVRGALRWRAVDFAAGSPGSVFERGAVLSLTLGWHHVVPAHFVDSGDRSLP